MKIRPVGARVLIKEVLPEEKTKSGIILVPSSKEKTQMATVLEVGQGTEENPILVKKGDIVVFSQYAGTEFKQDGDDKVRIIDIGDILAVVE